MNKEQFESACNTVIYNIKETAGIGTLQEKTIHSVLKHYISPDTANHEKRVKLKNGSSFIADIVLNNHIYEIQTGNFNLLRRKLDAYLPEFPVTIVYPLCYKKTLYWVDEKSGEISKPRKSPKTGRPSEIFPELYKIKGYLSDPNLSILIILLNIDEYKLLNGWSADRKKGASRNDGIPTFLVNQLKIDTIRDYNVFIPDELPKEFTVADYKKAAHVSQGVASIALHILCYLNVIEKIGKRGRAFLYSKAT